MNITFYEQDIKRIFNENELCYEYAVNDNGTIEVYIDWGDWKHDHRWCEDLMGYLGYGELGCEVTEEDGSDCYSAVHYFVKTA